MIGVVPLLSFMFGLLDSSGHLRWRNPARQRREEGLPKAGVVKAKEGMSWRRLMFALLVELN